MEKEQINAILLIVEGRCMLIADKTETAAQFHYKGCDFLYKATFQLQFLQWLNGINESEIITTTEHFIGIIGLLSGSSAYSYNYY